MKKALGLILLLMVCGGIFVACGDKKPAVDYTPADYFDVMQKEVEFPDAMMAMEADYLENQLPLKTADFESFVWEKSENMLLAENIIIIRAKDAASTATIKAALQKFADEQTEIFNEYVPDQGKIAAKSYIAVKGKTVFLIMSEKVEELKKIVK